MRHPGFCSSVITDHKLLVHHTLDEGDPTSSVDELLWRIDDTRPRAPFRMRPFPAGFRCTDKHLVIIHRNARKRAAEGDLMLLCSPSPSQAMTSSTDCHASGILMILPSPRSSVAAAGVGRPLQALRIVRSIVEPPASEGEPKASALGRHDDER